MQQTEIERKFLVAGDGWRKGAVGVSCSQGYIVHGPPVSVRVRVLGDKAWLTIKHVAEGTVSSAVQRTEFEYEIPAREARELLRDTTTGAIVEKKRYYVKQEGLTWEIDEFSGANAGLIVAEIELESADQAFARPPWLAEEVSEDPRYLNSNLALRPYSAW